MADAREAETRTGALSRRQFLHAVALVGGAAALEACQGPAPAAAPTTSQPTGAADRAAEWEQQWNALVEAARREGTVVFSGPPTPEVRRELPAAFKRRFGIEMEYLGGRTGDLMTRLEAERDSGQYTLDAMVAGAQTSYMVGYPKKLYDPLLPVLIHPDATDPSKWIGGRMWFMDPEEQYILRLSNYVSTNIVVHTEHVRPEELTSWRDLLDPRYRGKISVADPAVSGTGSNTAAYLLRMLGEDYVRALYQGQQPGVSREDRQLADWTARAIYPISLALGPNEIEALRKDGFPIAILKGFPEAPGYVTGGFGMASLINNAPHPNAAKLLLNWLAMKEGNEVYNRAQVLVSVRTDVDNSWAPDYIIPQPGVEYFDSHGWEFTHEARNPDELARIRRLTGR